jgi:hypothetical protein
VVKSEYTFVKAWAWAQEHGDLYDHVLAYWGNYSASCAYLFHRLMGRRVPFSMFLHAGTDLYRDQVFLREKLLYADNVFVVCDFNRQFIQARYADIYPRLEEKIHLHHLGLDLSEFPFRPAQRKPDTVLAVGSLEKIKGFDDLIRAIAALAGRGAGLRLDVIGSGPERERLGELATRLGVASRVTFHGFLPFEDVRRAMADATMRPSVARTWRRRAHGHQGGDGRWHTGHRHARRRHSRTARRGSMRHARAPQGRARPRRRHRASSRGAVETAALCRGRAAVRRREIRLVAKRPGARGVPDRRSAPDADGAEQLTRSE